VEKLDFVPYDKDNINHYESFLKLFSDYFDEICVDKPDENIPKHVMPRIINIIGEETSKYNEWLYLCRNCTEIIGFVLAQIDTPDNPMCKREGWGFIREFYINPSFRRKGYAKQMCEFIEKIIRKNGSSDIYLTSDAKTGVPFWEAMGYVFFGKVDDKNGNKIYEKHNAL
jgi:GNAT superfamily N-acetyltransferase